MINRDRILDMIADLPDEDLIEISVLVEKTFRKSCIKASRCCNYLSIAGDVIMDIDRITINWDLILIFSWMKAETTLIFRSSSSASGC